MEIISFGGHIKNEDVPVGRVTNTESSQQASLIMKHMETVPDGSSGKFPVKNFGPYERYALQNRLQKRGLKGVVRIEGERDTKGIIKSGTLFVLKFTNDQWKAYNAQPGATPAKK